MPIECSIVFPRLSVSDMAEIDFRVMRHVFGVHNALGCLCDESVYQNLLAPTLIMAGIHATREVSVKISFRTFSKPLYLDLVVYQSVIYELKAIEKITPAHVNQLLNYLFLTNSARGKLVNFRPSSVESQFVNATLDDSERRR